MRIAQFLLWRAFRGVLTVLIMIAVTFALYFAIEKQPPVANFFPQVSHGVPATPQEVHFVRHLYYLDRSKPALFGDYLWQLVRGDFGREKTIFLLPGQKPVIADTEPVGPVYVSAARETLSILLGGAVFVLLFSLPLGAISGSRLGSWRDRIIAFLALALLCTHPMMLGLILRSGGGSIHWLPTQGYCPLIGHTHPPSFANLPTGFIVPKGVMHFTGCGGIGDWASHLILPWMTFALLFLALYTRMIRASVAETIDEDYVRTARAKGASPLRVLARHVLPSAGLRVLTMVGMEIGTAIGVCVYIEAVFSIDGLGSAAIQQLGGTLPGLDLYADLAIVVLITLIVVAGNLLVDALYAFLDPRVGLERGSGGRSKSLVGGVF